MHPGKLLEARMYIVNGACNEDKMTAIARGTYNIRVINVCDLTKMC